MVMLIINNNDYDYDYYDYYRLLNYLRGKSNLKAVVKDFNLSYFENILLYSIFPKYLMKYCKLWSLKPPSALQCKH